MARYTHTQSSPNTTWTVNHNLGRKPIFDVFIYVGSDLVKVFPNSVEHVTDNQMIITFSSARTGEINCSSRYSSNPDQTPPAPGDPYWANVQSLLHFNGANGSTTFTDEKGLTWTSVSSAALSTSDKKFGSASLYLNAPSNQFINNSNSSVWDIASGLDFTFECFFNPSSNTNAIFGRWKSSGVWPNHFLLRHTNTKVQWWWNNSNIIDATYSVSLGTWYHVAISRASGVQKLFINGTQIGSTVNNNTGVSSIYGMSIGSENASPVIGEDVFSGYIDEFRFTKGYARYTSNFTPPVAEFLNS